MSAELIPLGFMRLLDWIVRERAAYGTVFGLHQDLFRLDLRGRADALLRRGHLIETPFGVAAGPHTQLSQNLVAAWLCGARFLELKTVQVLDELDIARPCIDMRDEGYNCEWSQELAIDVSADQYLDAWVAIRSLQTKAGAYDAEMPGFVMDMSVGYDLAGVQSAKVTRFLERLTVRARPEIEMRLQKAVSLFPRAAEIHAPERISDSVTISTMHGCPPEEIERIARYLLEERNLDVAIKLNPTLLGAAEVRALLNDTLGFPIEVPDSVFAEDLQWDAACDLIDTLTAVAARVGRSFGVKLTNTLACVNRGSTLPPSEEMTYLSGRALHPISVATAARLQETSAGALDISFAGGVDARNVVPLVAAGLTPVTVCSDLLRPGGYQRMHQYLDDLAAAMKAAQAPDLGAFVRAVAGGKDGDVATLALANLQRYARDVQSEAPYQSDAYHDRNIKTARPLGAFDCIDAPCVDACPADQDVPEYLHHTAQGNPAQALAVVLRDNPFPTVTGMVCDHPCLERCTRVNYEETLRIRDVKRTLAHTAPEPTPPAPAPPTGRSAAVVGGGPAGLACAWYLTLAGVRTTVYEAKDTPGGMVTDAIPVFRLSAEDVERDRRRIEAAGVEIRTGERINAARLAALQRDHDAVMLAIGAQRDRELGIPGDQEPGVWSALRLLTDVRHGATPDLGHTVVVIGGGNTAMDAARTAVRLLPPDGEVHLVYRRTWAQMPAARDELEALRAENVTLHQLLAPVEIRREDGRLALFCAHVELGAPDASGRPRPEIVPDSFETIRCDAIIPAVGQQLVGDLLTAEDRPVAADQPLSGDGLVFVGGDALRGAASLIEAIADGHRTALAVLASLGLPRSAPPAPAPRLLTDAEWQDRAARLRPALHPRHKPATGAGNFDLVIGELTPEEAQLESARCLDCSIRCDVCVAVCPNRANLVFETAPVRWSLTRLEPNGKEPKLVPDGEFVVAQDRQTCNLVDFCNECGNCTTFCPTVGAPFVDKPRFVMHPTTGDDEGVVHYLACEKDAITITCREGEREDKLTRRDAKFVYETAVASVVLDAQSFAVQDVRLRAPLTAPLSLRPAAALAVLLDGLADHPLVAGKVG